MTILNEGFSRAISMSCHWLWQKKRSRGKQGCFTWLMLHPILWFFFHLSYKMFNFNGTPTSYVCYQRGLQQGDHLSPHLFILVTDALSAMFNHALASGVLVGAPFGMHGRMCHMQYADDLLLIMAGSIEDLKIFKLIIYLFEVISGLAINFLNQARHSSRSNRNEFVELFYSTTPNN